MQSFKTKQDVVDYLKSVDWLETPTEDAKYFYQKGTYILKHGEYDRPDFKPQRYKDGWGIKVVFYFHANTYGAHKDQRCNVYQNGDYVTKENINNYQ